LTLRNAEGDEKKPVTKFRTEPVSAAPRKWWERREAESAKEYGFSEPPPKSNEEIEYVAVYNQRLAPSATSSMSPFMRSRTIATATTFDSAVHAADTFAAEKIPFHSINKNATWRKLPATQAQLDLLNRSRDEEHKLKEGSITKGKAGDLITKLKHGAKGRFVKYATAKRKVMKIAEKEQKTKVQVGPLKRSTFS